MRLRGMRPRKFQMGGGAGGTSFSPLPNPNLPQQLAAARWGAGAAPGAAVGAAGAAPGAAAQANPLAQQLAARGVMPTAAAGLGAGSTLGAAAPGAMPGAGNLQPRPGMGWGGAPGAGPMGAPAGGATGMAGAGAMPGIPPGGVPPQQQALMGALAGRGAGALGAGMPGAAPGLMGAGGAGANPQLLAALAAGGAGVPGAGPGAAGVNPAALPQLGVGFARGGRVVPPKGTTGPIKRMAENSFDSTKPVSGNLPTRPGKAKMAEGGRVSKFDSTRGAPGNLPTSASGKKLAKGGVVRRKPPAAKAAKAKEDRKSPSPAPYYDTAPAGDDGWPPTPSFTGAPGPNLPPPTPNPSPQALAPGMAKGGKWIAGAIQHPGALHKQLGVPQGEKIPAKKLAKAAQAGGKLGQRARLAEKLKGFKKAKGGKCVEDTDKDGMRKGGECDKMAAGGAAKQRKGFPNTIPPPKRMATGGGVRGTGIAQRGTRFSGIY